MKFGMFFANSGPFSNPETFEVLVRTADEVGVESIWTVEHVVVPVGYQSQYPYSKDGRMPGPEDSTIPDPILPLAYAAAITQNLRLATGIVILPQRHPAYVAKEFASLDLLSKGRAIAGIGIGWLEEEFNVIGVPFKERAARTEESVRAIRSLWSEKPEPFEGKFYNWPAVESNPKPVQPGGVPIVVGGHVEGAARRAARIGDGFFPAKGDLETLPKLFDALSDECAKVGRKSSEIELSAAGGKLDLDTIRRYEDIGVSRLVIPPPGFDPEGLRRGLNELADNVISKQ
jgi:probable F420-dependent oxidoreductase